MAAPTALVGGAAAAAAAPPPPKNDVLQQLGVAALRTRMQDLRSTIERIIQTFLSNPSFSWPEALAQFSIVNAELLSLVDDIKLVLKQFVVYPKNVNAAIAPILPIMLSSKLLPELEAEEASLKEQLLTPLSNLTHQVQLEKLQKHIELVRAVCDTADKALSDSRKSLGFTGRQVLPLAPTLDKMQAAKILEQEKHLHAAANFGEGLRIPTDQRNLPATAPPPHIASALAPGDQAPEGGNKAPPAAMRAAVSQQGNVSGSLNVATNSPRPGNLAELQMQQSLHQQQQRPSMTKVAQRFPHQRFPQAPNHPGQQQYQPVKMHQYPQNHQIHQQLQQQQLQQHIQLQLQQQGHAISQGNQLRNFGSTPASSLLSSTMMNQPGLGQHRLQQFGLSQPQRSISSQMQLPDPLYMGAQSVPMQHQLPVQLPGQPAYGLMGTSPGAHVLNPAAAGGMLPSNTVFNQLNGMPYGQPRPPPPAA